MVIDQLRRCRVIARFGIGVDMIDLDAATERGILVCNTATYCLDEVSNHAMGLLLMLNRGLLQDVDALRSGGWFRSASTPPRRLAGQRLGLVGLGNIGRLVAQKARGFGLDVVAYDPYVRDGAHDGITLVDLDELLAGADIVSVHCPLNASTHHLLGARELGLMKPSAFSDQHGPRPDRRSGGADRGAVGASAGGRRARRVRNRAAGRPTTRCAGSTT